MKKLIFKWIIIIITFFIFLYAFSLTYSVYNIDNLNYVVALILDKADDPQMIQVTFEFLDISSFSQDSSTTDASPILDTITATSIDSAINIMNSYSGKGINLSTCKVVIFSKELAEKGIYEEVSDLINSTQIRPNVNVIVTTESAKYYIDNSTSPLEKILTKYYDVFPNSSKYIGYTSNITIGQFYENFKNSNIGNVAILGGTNESSIQNKKISASTGQNDKSSESTQNSDNSIDTKKDQNEDTSQNSNQSTEQNSSQNSDSNSSTQVLPENMTPGNSGITGQRGNENMGLAVFSDYNCIGNLTAGETLARSIITNETSHFLISVPDPFESDKRISMNMSKNSDCKVNIDILDDHPVINITISLESKINSIIDGVNYADNETLLKLEQASEEYLKNHMLDYLYKTSKEFKVDITGFYHIAKKHFSTIDDMNNYNWRDKYPNSEFNLTINSNLVSSLLVQNN